MSSILPKEMRGVMSITGYRGSGKSFLASQADFPKNIAFFDFENKGEGIENQLQFGKYRALTQEAGENPLTLFKLTMQAFNDIAKDEYTTIILDNISPFEVSMNAEALSNAPMYAERYGLNLKNVKAGRFGGTKSIVNFMISSICAALHAKGVKLVITTSHIKPRWSSAGPIPNKYNPLGADKWQELSILTLILIPGSHPPVPSALVQKEQLGIISISNDPSPEQLEAMMRGEEGHVIQRRLPPRIDKCTFQKVRWYLYNPVDFNDLKEGEMPTFEEADPFDEKLNKEQFRFVEKMMEANEREEQAQEKALEQLEVQQKEDSIMRIVVPLRSIINEHGELPPPSYLPFLKAKGVECTMPELANALARIRNGS